jgi:hypothetical protein
MKLLLIPILHGITTLALGEEAGPLKIWREKVLPIVPQQYLCHYTATPLVVDGKIDEAAWAAAPWTADFQDIEGDAKPKPTFRTRAKMLWDDQYFYIAAEMEEPHVWGTLIKHDEVIFADPDFEVFLDPDGDTHEYYEFEMNALNTGWDLFLPKPYKDGGKAQNEWEIPGLKTAVQVRGTLNNPSDKDQGWDVELAIPWKVLAEFAHRPAPPVEGDQWRAGFSRVEWQIEIKDGKYVKIPKTPENNWVWSPQGVIDMHRPESWGYVQFTKRAPGAVEFKPDPAAKVRYALMEVYYAQVEYFKKHSRWSLDFKELGVTPSSTEGTGDWTLRATPDGYECSVAWSFPSGGTAQRWSIQQDSHLQQMK